MESVTLGRDRPAPRSDQGPVELHLAPVINLSDEQLFELCGRNRELRIERSAEGDLEIMTPAGGLTSDRNAEIIMQLRNWAKAEGRGRVFDSSAGFLLPNGAMRSPDAAWVLRERLARLPKAQRERFLPLVPDFVVELRSPSDSRAALEEKMVEYQQMSVRLGWLIDPERREVGVYRPGEPPEQQSGAKELAGDPELPGFVLELEEIWDPAW